MREVRSYEKDRQVKDTNKGRRLQKQIDALEQLLDAYSSGEVAEGQRE